MDFSLTPDQELLRDTGRKLLERECPPALVRAHIDDPAVYEPFWRHLARVHRARRRRGDRPLLVPRRDRLRRRARTLPRDRAVHRRSRATTARPPAPVAFVDDPTNPVRARSRPRRAHRGRRPGPALTVVVDAPTCRPLEFVADRRLLAPLVPHRHRRARRECRTHRRRRGSTRGATARTRHSRPRWSAPRVASSTWRSRTRRNASSSTCRSARSRRSSTSSPTCRSRSNGRPPRCTTRAMTFDADDRRPRPRVPRRQGGRRRGGAPHPEGRHPDPRRHRLHVGARPPPVPAPGHRRRVPARHDRLAPRPPRRPAVRRGLMHVRTPPVHF